MSIKKTVFLLLFAGCAALPVRAADEASAAAAASAIAGPSVFDQFLDSVGISRADLEAKANSTKMFGGSSPVSFSGEGRVKLQYHNLVSDEEWTINDRSYVQSGWEGNESMIRMGMVVRPGRNAVLYGKIGFQSTLPGNRWKPSTNPNGAVAPYLHDKSLITANIHEDMNAGLAVRTVPASFWLRMGNVNWIEASPFTVWKAQPRTFAWEYLPYEVEQPIARYYEYNIANGEKAGRAAWHKKAFNGINFESINLPGRLYLNLLWAAYERYDNYEQEYVDFSNDLAYAGDNTPLKGTGIGDSYRNCFHARLAANQLFGELTPGFNFLRLDYNDDVITAQDGNGYLFLKALRVNSSKGDDFKGTDSMPTLNDSAFYKEPKVFSVDVRGPIFNRFIDLHADLAFSQVDTTFLIWDSVSSNIFTKSYTSSKFAPAFYTKAAFNTRVPFQLDITAIAKGFYSPLSFAAPQDAFYAFNSNMVGSGKFMARGEASPYAQNMAGALLSVTPKLPGYGHMRVAYGQHAQIKPGRDILYMPYRLNGLDFFSLWHSTYSRWGNNPLMTPAYMQHGKRLGNENFISPAYQADDTIPPLGNESGGIYTDYLSSYYCFVPWDNVDAARKNVKSQSKNVSYARSVTDTTAPGVFVTDSSATGYVPVHQKFTNNLELDVSYDISGMVGYPNDLFIGGFASINNVTTAFSPLAVSDKGKETQLWSVYLRFEPAIAITKKFYILGILGFENWRSQMAMMDVPDTVRSNQYLSGKTPLLTTKNSSGQVTHAYYNVPIDFRDAAFGLGFDWEILSRVGLHGRFKYMQHKDVNYTYNNWGTPVASLEIKTWF